MAALIVLVILIGAAAFAPLDSATTTAPAEQPTIQTTELTGKLVSTTGENEGTSTTQAQTQPTELTTTMKREELTTPSRSSSSHARRTVARWVPSRSFARSSSSLSHTLAMLVV
uniref:Secreted protein n=1 Tax=Globodera pallida TaxID=36090 RepID=A0A183CIL3_GLOPA